MHSTFQSTFRFMLRLQFKERAMFLQVMGDHSQHPQFPVPHEADFSQMNQEHKLMSTVLHAQVICIDYLASQAC